MKDLEIMEMFLLEPQGKCRLQARTADCTEQCASRCRLGGWEGTFEEDSAASPRKKSPHFKGRTRTVSVTLFSGEACVTFCCCCCWRCFRLWWWWGRVEQLELKENWWWQKTTLQLFQLGRLWLSLTHSHNYFHVSCVLRAGVLALLNGKQFPLHLILSLHVQ